MSPIQGFTRYRAWQFGKETTFGTAVAATRRLPWTGDPSIQPNWVDPQIDAGVLDPVIQPYRTTSDYTATLTGPLAFNDLPYIFSPLIKGGVTPTTSGTSKQWVYQAVSSNSDPWEYLTAEWGDDVVADQFQFISGVAESTTLTLPEDLGPWTHSTAFRWAKLGTYPTTRTGGLSVDASPTWAYGADTEVYLDSTAGGIGTTKLLNTVHSASITITNTVDQKRYADGSNTRFQIAGFGRAARDITTTLTLAKQTATMTEVANFLSNTAVDRFIEFRVTSTSTASAGIPYSWTMRLPARWVTRSEATQGGNDMIVLTAHGFYDASGLGYPFRTVVTNQLASL